MTQPIDEVFVEIEPDTRNFDRKLIADTDKAYDKLKRSTEQVTKKITESFDSAGRKIERTFTSIEKDGVVTTRVIEKAFNDAGDRIQRAFKLVSDAGVDADKLIAEVSKLAADSTADSFERAGERIEDAFREASRVARRETRQIERAAVEANNSVSTSFGGLQRTIAKVGETIVSLGSALVGLAAAAPTPAGLIAILLTVVAIGAAVGPVIVLTGALADLIGLIGAAPAALGVLAAAIAPVVIAFQGFGDAIGAIIKKDPDKITKALKRLSPAAREVARDFQRALPALEKLQRVVQQNFFAPFANTIDKFVKNILPTLQKGLAAVARAAGRQLDNLFDVFNHPDNIAFLNRLFATTAKLIDTIGPAFARFADALLSVADAGLPFITRFGKAIADVVDRFATFIEQSTKTGAFNKFVEDAIATFNQLLDLTKALGHLFVALFSDADDEGRSFIQTLTKMIDDLATFLETPKGKDALQDVVDSVKNISLAIIGLGQAIQAFIGFFGSIDDAVASTIDTVARWQDGIVAAFNGALDAVGGFFSAIGNFFAKLPGQIIGFISSLPGMLIDFFKFVFDSVLRAIGVGIGLLLFEITVLPGLIIDRLKQLPGQLADFFTKLWAGARDRTVAGGNSIVDFVKGLPGRLVALLRSIGPLVANIFRDAVAAARNFVVNGFNAIVNFIRGVPGRIKAAFTATGSFLSDIAGSIAGAIKGFLNRAIDKINSGISDVDNFLPGSLPRIPRLARGGVVEPSQGGTLAVLAEAGQREIATPEKLLRKIIAEEGGQGVVFQAGAIVVEFHGAVPTEAEARRTGLAVGMGVSDTLARRDVRTRVRAL